MDAVIYLGRCVLEKIGRHKNMFDFKTPCTKSLRTVRAAWRKGFQTTSKECTKTHEAGCLDRGRRELEYWAVKKGVLDSLL